MTTMVEVKERPILFSAPMVCALLDGRKTQTRRIIKPQPVENEGMNCRRLTYFTKNGKPSLNESIDPVPVGQMAIALCPHGDIGDRLWVRETFQPLLADDLTRYKPNYKTGEGYKVSYPATDGIVEYYDMATDSAFCSNMKPSIFMPRWASRITLEITEVRVVRLQDIGEEDAIAEGVESPDAERYEHDFSICPRCAGTRLYTAFSGNGGALPDTDCELCDTHVKRYSHLWESINGAGSWAANPWVWAITFKVAR